MRFNEIALNAVNRLFTSLSVENRDATRSELRNTIARIRARWSDVVYVRGRSIYSLEENTTELDGSYYFYEDLATCDCCEAITSDARTVYSRVVNRLTEQAWCEECADDSSFYCMSCDQRFNDAEEITHNDSFYCRACYDEECRFEIPSYHSAHRWSIEDHSAPLYSLELELEAEERDELVMHLMVLDYPKVSWEMDGSLDRSKGLEVLIQLRESTDRLSNDACDIISNIKKRGFSLSSWNNKRCGIHLNSNRTMAWNKKNVMRLLYCVRMARESLVRISGRDCTQWASWDSRGHSLERQAEGSMGKYTMLRVGCDRFEWRMFRGTLNEKRVALYCETVKQFEALALSETSIYHLKDEAIKLGIELSNKL